MRKNMDLDYSVLLSYISWICIVSGIVLLSLMFVQVDTLDNEIRTDEITRLQQSLIIDEKTKQIELMDFYFAYQNGDFSNVRRIGDPVISWLDEHGFDYLVMTFPSGQRSVTVSDATLDFSYFSEFKEGSDEKEVGKSFVTDYKQMGRDYFQTSTGYFAQDSVVDTKIVITLGQRIDSAFWGDFGKKYMIDGIEIAPLNDQDHSIYLKSARGDSVGYLKWNSNLPGERLIPQISLVILVSFLYIIYIIKRILVKEKTNREGYEKELFKQATTDTLTGIYNRQYVLELANKELSLCRRQNHPFSVLMFDIDHFKRINDTHGHQVGDKALQHFAKLVKKTLRTEDVFGRIGGEEFILVLPETNTEGANEVAERIRELIAINGFVSSVGKINFTVSIGLAQITGTETLTECLDMADKAMYEAKSLGRNRVSAYISESIPKQLSLQY